MAGRYDCLAGQLAVLMRAIDCLTCIVQASRAMHARLCENTFSCKHHTTHTHMYKCGVRFTSSLHLNYALGVGDVGSLRPRPVAHGKQMIALF